MPQPANSNSHIMGVYARANLAFERGEGVWLYTPEGDAYLDAVAGIATTGLGHANPILVKALSDQAAKLWHVSNIFQIPGQEELARKLTDATFADVCFFTNSGTESIECALKTARKYHAAKGQPERIDIIGFDGSFHGRSYAAVNASGNESYMAGFGPRLPGYIQSEFSNWDELRQRIGDTTAGVIIEPVQGEGGARALSADSLLELRQICDEAGILLIYDEIQCGMGRTGKLFAYEWAGEDAAPDIMAVAKALGGGFPVGACLATKEAASGMVPGTHGSTYGGNPLAMAVGNAAFDEIIKPSLLDNVVAVSGYLNQQLTGLKDRFPDIIEDIRGKGLLIGIKVKPNNREFMQMARDEHLLIAGGGDNCVRLVPALNITQDEARQVVERLEKTCLRAREAAK